MRTIPALAACLAAAAALAASPAANAQTGSDAGAPAASSAQGSTSAPAHRRVRHSTAAKPSVGVTPEAGAPGQSPASKADAARGGSSAATSTDTPK